MMKYLLIVLLIAVISFMMGVKRARPPERPAAPPPQPQPPQPRDIVSCTQCGLHLPQDEALPGRGGFFCGASHRAAYEAKHAANGQS